VPTLPSTAIGPKRFHLARARLPIPAVAAPDPPAAYDVTLGRPPSFINSLPGHGNAVALTIDDGRDASVVAGYADLAEATGLRLTFFVTGQYPSWTRQAARLRPLVERGQIQLANHTWTHPDIRTLSDGELADELTRTDRLLRRTFGVTSRPFFRPPFGFRDERTDRVCAEVGFSSIVMWYGSFGDSAPIARTQLLELASTWLRARRVVIGHANYRTVLGLYPELMEILSQRQLQTVTLDDVFYGPGGRHPAAR
jgi:peptidoglycan/xylan/chitin deacetylase (PgdA/CDA1 family)